MRGVPDSDGVSLYQDRAHPLVFSKNAIEKPNWRIRQVLSSGFDMSELPGYWTAQEIATELRKSPKWVVHKIVGRGSKKPELKAIKAHRLWFVKENDAKAFIKRYKGG